MAILNDVGLALRAARAGAGVVREMYGGPLVRVDKGGGDFATAADLAAEEAIREVLREARPADAVTGEEGGDSGMAGAERRWLVDPLCGTLNYAVGTLVVAVNVALRVGGEVAVAAVADPFTDEVFWTQGAHAYLLVGGVEVKVVPSADSRLVEVNLDPPFPNAPGFSAAALLADPGFGALFRPRVVSSTLAVAWVAAGRRAAYVTDGRLRDSVHFAAGIALCQAAGCVVTGIRGEPLHEGAGGLVAAADRRTHEALLEIIGRQ